METHILSGWAMAIFREITGIEPHDNNYKCALNIQDITDVYHKKGSLLEVDKIVVCTSYTQDFAEQLERVKYIGDARALTSLDTILLEGFDYMNRSFIKTPPTITYVPIGLNRFVQRGFNQGYLLANLLACTRNLKLTQEFYLPWSSGHQAHRTKIEREKNEIHFYKKSWRHNQCGNTILIVDDVISTGTTLENYSKSLSRLGYTNIFALILSRKDQS